MSKYLSFPMVAVLVALILAGILLVSCRNNREYHSFSFYFNGRHEKATYLKSATVLGRNVRMGFHPNSHHRGGNIHYSRADCTPDALLITTADFVWWDKRFTDPESKSHAPLKPEQKLTCSLPFPEFDWKQDWTCTYTLQEYGRTWVGRFDGVKPKAIGAEPKKHAGRKQPKQPWLYVFFRNQTGREVWLSQPETQFINGDFSTKLYLDNLPANGQFQGFAAHSQIGSIYRPKVGGKILGTWGHRGAREHHSFEHKFPEFSPKKENWYCYFTLNKDQTWTVEFEGTVAQMEGSPD
jgi:hypothetical protein